MCVTIAVGSLVSLQTTKPEVQPGVGMGNPCVQPTYVLPGVLVVRTDTRNYTELRNAIPSENRVGV